MADILIRGYKIPCNCGGCDFFFENSLGAKWCGIKHTPTVEAGRPDWCPLIALPEGHGDLIERQKLLEDNKHLEYPTDGKYRRDRAWAVGFNAGARHCRDLAEEAGMARHNRAMEFFRNEIQSLERAPELNGCTMTQEWRDQIDAYRYAIAACNKFMEEKDRAKE